MSFLEAPITILNETETSIELEIQNETHTVANILVDELLKLPACTFAAYKLKNPKAESFLLKYSVKENEDLKNTFLEAIRNSLVSIKEMEGSLKL